MSGNEGRAGAKRLTASGQRVDEWQVDGSALPYHLGQWDQPKRSTEAFAVFIEPQMAGTPSVVDLGCGAGGATCRLARRFARTAFLGIDYSHELIGLAGGKAAEAGIANAAFEQDDWFDLRARQDVDGVISLQTLSWLPEFERPMQRIFERLRPRWIALSSLFHEGDISCRIEVTEHAHGKSSFYNVYSQPAIDRLARDHGYALTRSEAFELDIDLPRPADPDRMGTYTIATMPSGADGPRRLQVSGPLLMNWRFLMLERQQD